MEEKIIPEKEPLFQPKIQQNPKKKAPQQIQPEPQVQFNIPVKPQIQLQSQPVIEQTLQQQEPEKKKTWRKWIVIAAIVLVVIGLGFYFLAG